MFLFPDARNQNSSKIPLPKFWNPIYSRLIWQSFSCDEASRKTNISQENIFIKQKTASSYDIAI
jgi:hypothetical protein